MFEVCQHNVHPNSSQSNDKAFEDYVYYLNELLKHQSKCETTNCKHCQTNEHTHPLCKFINCTSTLNFPRTITLYFVSWVYGWTWIKCQREFISTFKNLVSNVCHYRSSSKSMKITLWFLAWHTWPRLEAKLHIMNHESKEITIISSNIFLLVELFSIKWTNICSMGSMFVNVAFEKPIHQ